MLLSITTLSIADIIEEEEVSLTDEAENNNQWREKAVGRRRHKELVSSLQVLGDYESLLVPPPSVISAANQAAAKAMMSVSGLPVGSGYLESINLNDKTINCSKLYFQHGVNLAFCCSYHFSLVYLSRRLMSYLFLH